MSALLETEALEFRVDLAGNGRAAGRAGGGRAGGRSSGRRSGGRVRLLNPRRVVNNVIRLEGCNNACNYVVQMSSTHSHGHMREHFLRRIMHAFLGANFMRADSLRRRLLTSAVPTLFRTQLRFHAGVHGAPRAGFYRKFIGSSTWQPRAHA